MPSLAVKTLKEVLYLNKGMVYSGLFWGGLISVLAAVKTLQTQCAILTGLSWFGLILGFGAATLDLVLEVMQDWAYTAPFGGDEHNRTIQAELDRFAAECRAVNVAGNDNDAITKKLLRRKRFELLREAPKAAKPKGPNGSGDGVGNNSGATSAAGAAPSGSPQAPPGKQDKKPPQDDNMKRRKAFNVPRDYEGISCIWFQTMRCLPMREEAFCLLSLDSALRFAGNVTLFCLVVLGTLDTYREKQSCRDPLRHWFPTLIWLAPCTNLVRLFIGFTYKERESKKKAEADAEAGEAADSDSEPEPPTDRATRRGQVAPDERDDPKAKTRLEPIEPPYSV